MFLFGHKWSRGAAAGGATGGGRAGHDPTGVIAEMLLLIKNGGSKNNALHMVMKS